MLATLGIISSEHVSTDGGVVTSKYEARTRGSISVVENDTALRRTAARPRERRFHVNLWVVFAEDDQATHQIDVSGPLLGYVISRSSTPLGAVPPI